jgi:AcrR family transcriptional regulator
MGDTDGMVEYASRHPTRRRREETRQAIVDAGFRLFSRQGYSRTSVRDIAAAVGVTDAALYKHFASKKELLDAVLEERGAARWDAWLAEMRGRLPLHLALEQVVLSALRFAELNRDLLRLILFEALAGDDGVLSHHIDVMNRWRTGVASLATGGRSALDTREAAQLAELLAASVWGITVERLVGATTEPFCDASGEPSDRSIALAQAIVSRLLSSR